nr:hypothetical protein [Bradyrhizobium sp. dw_411]
MFRFLNNQFALGFFVIARSVSDEAIHTFFDVKMDCFACARNDEVGRLFPHQRIHVLHGLDEIFLEFLHHGAGGFHAVDQADALSDEVADEVARPCIA